MNFDNEQKAHEAIAQTAGYRLEKNYRFAVSLTSGNTLPESSSNRTVCFVRTAHDQNKGNTFHINIIFKTLIYLF
jgi:hypothetical protein